MTATRPATLPGADGPIPLHRAPAGVPLVVRLVERAHAATLAAEGVVAGVAISVESAVPLRGAVVVRLGRARLALGRAVAATVIVEPAGLPADDPASTP